MDTNQKALNINLDETRYGVFAEIGAGQEVARHFFQAGKASQTIAKTISAYDMIVSDEVYGKEKSGRYVCESRVKKMLDHEYKLLVDRLDSARGEKSAFFAFADTVATHSGSSRQSHGWMGVRFQSNTRVGKNPAETNEIIIHVRLLDRHRLQQQEALGKLGVNLLDSAFYRTQSVEAFLKGLMDGFKENSIAIDLIRMEGKDLSHLDLFTLNLMLVKQEIADALIFTPNMEIKDLGETIFEKSLLIQRGNFNPVTKTHLDILSKGEAQMKASGASEKSMLSLMELHLPNSPDDTFSEKNFLRRIQWLTQAGQTVLVSRFKLFYGLKGHLRRYTTQPISIVLGASQLENVFDESHYQNLDGGLLEGLGKLLDIKTKLYIYPHKTANICLTTKSFFPTPQSLKIYQHFIEQKMIVDIAGCDDIETYLHSGDIMKKIEKKDESWKKDVPSAIVSSLEKYR